jgi:hypothetical protein
MDYQKLIERLNAPAYWMSGSSDGHEGENDAPREAAEVISTLLKERDALVHDLKRSMARENELLNRS